MKSLLSSYRSTIYCRAQTTVEFALIFLPFCILLFAITDYAQIFFFKNALQNGLRESARFASTGNIIPLLTATNSVPITNYSNGLPTIVAINDDHGNQASRNYCIRVKFTNNCVVPVPLHSIDLVSCSVSVDQTSQQQLPPQILSGTYTIGTNVMIVNYLSPLNNNYGLGPGYTNYYVQILATYPVKTITPLMTYLQGYDRKTQSYQVVVSSIIANEPAYLNFFTHTNYYSYEYP